MLNPHCNIGSVSQLIAWTRAKRVIAAVLCGIALAWVVSAFGSLYNAPFRNPFFSPGHSEPAHQWPFTVPDNWPVPSVSESHVGVLWSNVRTRTQTEYVSLSTPFPVFEVVESRVGWPLQSFYLREAIESIQTINGMYREQWRRSNEGQSVIMSLESGILVSERPQLLNRGGSSVRLPVAPIWLGLLANSALYAVLVFCLLLIPQMLVRHFRRSTRTCIICGYPAQRDRCPECGYQNQHRSG